jgi:hypothetical protein
VNADFPASEPSEAEGAAASGADEQSVSSAEPAFSTTEPVAAHVAEPVAAPPAEPFVVAPPATETETEPAPPALVEPEPVVAQPVVSDAVAAPVVADALIETPAEPTVAEPVAAAPVAGVVATGLPAVAPDNRVVYVEPTPPPRKRGNRGLGVLIALGGTAVFAGAYAVALVIVELVNNKPADFTFVQLSTFWIPVAFFAVGFILLVLIANRASWWAYILGSIFVAVFVYFGSVVVLGLIHGGNTLTANEFSRELVSPGAIIAGLLAREVALWVGAGVAARGRRVKVRNAQRHQDWQDDEAARKSDTDAAWAPSA